MGIKKTWRLFLLLCQAKQHGDTDKYRCDTPNTENDPDTRCHPWSKDDADCYQDCADQDYNNRSHYGFCDSDSSVSVIQNHLVNIYTLSFLTGPAREQRFTAIHMLITVPGA